RGYPLLGEGHRRGRAEVGAARGRRLLLPAAKARTVRAAEGGGQPSGRPPLAPQEIACWLASRSLVGPRLLCEARRARRRPVGSRYENRGRRPAGDAGGRASDS